MPVSGLKHRFGLSHLACVVAGADGLLGSACVRALRSCGAKVIGLDVKSENKTHSDDRRVDITDSKALTAFFSELKGSSHGASGISEWAFVNCSYPRTSNWGELGFENFLMEDWNRNVELHLGSAFHFTQEAVQFLRTQEGGSLVNFGSIYGLVGPDLRVYDGTSMKNPAAYAAIKAGIIGLTRYVATSFGKENIRANVVCPGGIANHQPESFVQAYQQRTPLGRMGTPDDIGGAVAFLVGPSARYLTGQVLAIDGGWTTW